MASLLHPWPLLFLQGRSSGDFGPTQLIQDDLLVFLGTTIQTSTVFMHFLNIQIPKGDKVWEGQVLLFVETYCVPLDNSH